MSELDDNQRNFFRMQKNCSKQKRLFEIQEVAKKLPSNNNNNNNNNISFICMTIIIQLQYSAKALTLGYKL